MPRTKLLVGEHMAGGLNLASGARNLDPEENVWSRNMAYSPDGASVISYGYSQPSDWTTAESGEGIDGLYEMGQYTLLWKAVNGKILYTSAVTADFIEADTGISLTKDNPVFFTEYRGGLYYCNGVEDAAKISIGQLAVALVAGSETKFTVDLSVAATYRWTAGGGGTDEYYLELAAGGDPGIPVEPLDILENSVAMTPGTVDSLAVGEWDWGDSDSLGYNTIYVRLSDGADPDGKADDYVQIQDNKIDLGSAQGYHFNDATDKVYIGADEIDYYEGSGDELRYVRNNAGTHAVNAYVTQANTLTAAPSGSLKCTTMAMWRDTMWISGIADEPNVLRYSKTVASVGTVTNVENYTDGNNYLIGEGAEVTALLPTRDRLYVFTKDKVYYITIEISSAGTEVFSVDRVFSNNYGAPNPFCVKEVEDFVVFFTGSRLIKIGYDPENHQLLPSEKFDEEVYPVLNTMRKYTQTNARMHYFPHEKKLRLTGNIDNILKTITYDNRLDKYSYPDDHDVSYWASFNGYSYFGEPDDDVVHRIGKDIEGASLPIAHELWTGQYDLGSRDHKFFQRGVIEGFIGVGTTINFQTEVNGELVGGTRDIDAATHADFTADARSVGDIIAGSETEVGGGGDVTELYEFRYPFVIAERGEDIQLKFSSFAEGAIWAIDKWQVNVVLLDAVPDTAY